MGNRFQEALDEDSLATIMNSSPVIHLTPSYLLSSFSSLPPLITTLGCYGAGNCAHFTDAEAKARWVNQCLLVARGQRPARAGVALRLGLQRRTPLLTSGAGLWPPPPSQGYEPRPFLGGVSVFFRKLTYGAHPVDVAEEVMRTVRRKKQEVFLANPVPKAAVYIRTLFPELFFAVVAYGVKEKLSVPEEG